MRSELGVDYSKSLWEVFEDRLPPSSDFCCYWFEKARQQIQDGNCNRAGLLATTGAKQASSRRAFERILDTGRVFFAESDREWILDGASVRICMLGWTDRESKEPTILNGHHVDKVNADLSAGNDLTAKALLRENAGRCFMGTTKVGAFDIEQELALAFLTEPNPHGKPNSDVVRPLRNGSALVRRNSHRWIVDFGVATLEDSAALYEAPFRHLATFVKPERMMNTDPARVKYWWLFARPRPDFRAATANSVRYLATARVAKHRVFVWLDSVVLPDSKVIAVAFEDDFHFGVLQSRIHEVWTLATCGWHGVGNDATYNPTECFETFPFPDTTAALRTAVANEAKALNTLRDNWLSPPAWTTTRTLTFPGTASGPWQRYVRDPDVSGVGTVHYPLVEPRDAECAAKLAKRTLTNLYNERPAWLANAHAKLDAAVAVAYGWQDIADAWRAAEEGTIYDFRTKTSAQLDTDEAGLNAALSDFHRAVDNEILSRLLALNLSRAADEKATAKKPPAKERTSRAKTADELL